MRPALVALILVGCAGARPVALPSPPAADLDKMPLSADERAAELAFARDVLRESYAHLETKRAQWAIDLDAIFAEYEPRARKADTWTEHERVMAAFVAELHDAHLAWRRQRGAAERKRRIARLGLTTRFVGASLVVTDVWAGSGAERAGVRPGDRIIAVDGQTIEGRFGRLSTVRSWSRAEAARYDFAQEWPASRHFVDEPVPARRLTRERDDGSYETLIVEPETQPRPGGPPPDVELERRGAVHVLRLRTFGGARAETGRKIKAAIDEVFAGARGLVIDLRDNVGGYEDSACLVAAHLAAAPVVAGSSRVKLSARARQAHREWRDLVEDRAMPGWSEARPVRVDGLAPRPFPGRIAVLIDAGCRSACESLAMLLGALGARLVGERTGGSSGAPIEVTLPRTGARLTVPARAMFHASGAPIEGVGVAPDEVLAPSRADLGARRDVVLDRGIAIVTP